MVDCIGSERCYAPRCKHDVTTQRRSSINKLEGIVERLCHYVSHNIIYATVPESANFVRKVLRVLMVAAAYSVLTAVVGIDNSDTGLPLHRAPFLTNSRAEMYTGRNTLF